MQNPFLIGRKTYLRAPQQGDEIIIALSENHPDPRSSLFYALPASPEQQRIKIEKLTADQHSIAFTICTIDPDLPVGLTFFTRIDWAGRAAVFYIAIAEKENWSKGYGSEVTKMMADYAFKTLNLNRIQLHVHVENEKAVKAYKKAGYQIEGTLRQAMYFDGRYRDFYVMAVLKEQYKD
jgi:RimJ/RimL family protein N-acetyltransferase